MRFTTAFTAMLLTLLLAATAQASVYSFVDDVTTVPGWENHTSEDGRDVMGVPDFTIGTVSYENGNVMTGFSVDYTVNNSIFNSLNSGDLFINVNDDTTWDYVVDLNGRTGGSANIYSFNVDYTDASAYEMSWANGNYRDDHPTGAIITQDMSKVGEATWSGLTDYPFEQAATMTVSGLGLEYDVLSVGYTVSCANDVVYASGMTATPIPGAAWLLGSGLLGLVGWQRKSARQG